MTKRKKKNLKMINGGQDQPGGIPSKVDSATMKNPNSVPGNIVNPAKRVRVSKDEIQALNTAKAQFDHLIFQLGNNRMVYLQAEKNMNKQIEGTRVQINSLLKSYKDKYKCIGNPVDWDPKTNELILK